VQNAVEFLAGGDFVENNRFPSLKLDNYKPLRDIVFEAIKEAILKRAA